VGLCHKTRPPGPGLRTAVTRMSHIRELKTELSQPWRGWLPAAASATARPDAAAMRARRHHRPKKGPKRRRRIDGQCCERTTHCGGTAEPNPWTGSVAPVADFAAASPKPTFALQLGATRCGAPSRPEADIEESEGTKFAVPKV
jgi:hypothetical protein